jgi:predicted nuclease of predicted toxin-antitoxin system
MKFLIDVNIERFIINALKTEGYDVKTVVSINPTFTDKEIIELAHNEKRIILTNDKDFGELVFNPKESTSGIILFRDINKDLKLEMLLIALKQIESNNFFIVIRKDRIVNSTIKWEK